MPLISLASQRTSADRPSPLSWRRPLLWVGVMGGLLAGVVGVLGNSSTTKQGINYQVVARPIPLYVKTLDFLHRHYQHRLLAERIVEGSAGESARVLAVFQWTLREIRSTPADWPVHDDHILNIIIRRYGLDDQKADVFATLSTYAGVPAFWQVLRDPASGESLVLCFAKVGGTWAVFDVEHGLVFRTRSGAFASLEDLVNDPELIETAARGLKPRGIPYARYLTRLPSVRIPRPLRAELQMPGPRVWYELRQHLGLARGLEETG